jgi:hypothetical protein
LLERVVCKEQAFGMVAHTNHNCSTFILLFLSKPWVLLVFHDESKELKVPSKVHPGFSR